MPLRSAFLPQQQFHLLIDMQGIEHSIAVLPDGKGLFLIINQGSIIGELGFDKQLGCISNRLNLNAHLIEQLHVGIKNHY